MGISNKDAISRMRQRIASAQVERKRFKTGTPEREAWDRRVDRLLDELGKLLKAK